MLCGTDPAAHEIVADRLDAPARDAALGGRLDAAVGASAQHDERRVARRSQETLALRCRQRDACAGEREQDRVDACRAPSSAGMQSRLARSLQGGQTAEARARLRGLLRAVRECELALLQLARAALQLDLRVRVGRALVRFRRRSAASAASCRSRASSKERSDKVSRMQAPGLQVGESLAGCAARSSPVLRRAFADWLAQAGSGCS